MVKSVQCYCLYAPVGVLVLKASEWKGNLLLQGMKDCLKEKRLVCMLVYIGKCKLRGTVPDQSRDNIRIMLTHKHTSDLRLRTG